MFLNSNCSLTAFSGKFLLKVYKTKARESRCRSRQGSGVWGRVSRTLPLEGDWRKGSAHSPEILVLFLCIRNGTFWRILEHILQFRWRLKPYAIKAKQNCRFCS